MRPSGLRRLVILAEGQFAPHSAKTAFGVIRYARDDVVAVLDSTRAGQNVASYLPGHDIPIVATLVEVLARPDPPDALLIGIAPTGGRLPDPWRSTILAAIDAGLDVLSGLHMFVGDDPEFAAAAARRGTRIVDYRRPPDRMETAVGRRHGPGKKVILTVGTDCAIGKMSVALELDETARSRGLASCFVPTGQTGIAIAGWGTAVDHVISDFVAGASEALVDEGAARGDLLFVEGQGALFHPAYSGVTLGLLHGTAPDALVLAHKHGAERIYGYDDTAIPPLRDLVQAYELVSAPISEARVAAIALNTADVATDDAARATIAAVEDETGLPCDDVPRFGAERMLAAVVSALGAAPQPAAAS